MTLKLSQEKGIRKKKKKRAMLKGTGTTRLPSWLAVIAGGPEGAEGIVPTEEQPPSALAVAVRQLV